jgi:hypothetical protein
LNRDPSTLELWDQLAEAILIGDGKRYFRKELFYGLGRIVGDCVDITPIEIENRERFQNIAYLILFEGKRQGLFSFDLSLSFKVTDPVLVENNASDWQIRHEKPPSPRSVEKSPLLKDTQSGKRNDLKKTRTS